MPIIETTDITDVRLRVYSGLTDAQLRRGEYLPNSLSNGVFVAESRRVIERAMDAGLHPLSLFMEEKWLPHEQGVVDRVLEADPQTPVFVLTNEAFRSLTGYQVTRGALAAFERPAPLDPKCLLAQSRRVAILEGITNYANVGTIFRSAAALGVDAVFITPTCHDPLYRRCARVSMGAVVQVPWARIGSQADWTSQGMPLLHDAGFAVAAMALTEASVGFDDPQLASSEKLALVLGTEGDGLMQSTIDACDYTVRIPMEHDVDSLNVAAAAAIAFWEMRRMVG